MLGHAPMFKGVSLKAAGMLLSSCCVLLLVLWRHGVLHNSDIVRHNHPGVCSAAADSSMGRSDAQPPKQPHMVLYAHNCCEISKKRACDSALKHGFGSCGQFGLEDLNLFMLSPEGHSILTEDGSRGAGYWLWKPLIILQELLRAGDGDVVVYMDADSEIKSDIAPLVTLLDDQDIVGFSSCDTESNATKTDVMILLNATDLRDTQQLFAGLILLRRSWQSIGFVSQWLAYCQDKRWLTNMGNTLLPELLHGQAHPGFLGHRNDQALFSLLYKKWGFKVYPDPASNDTWARNHPNPDVWMFHHTEESEKKL